MFVTLCHYNSQDLIGSWSSVEEVAARHPPRADTELPLRQRSPRHSEARQVVLYAARQIAGKSLKEVGARFGLGYTALSRRVSALESRLEHELRLQKSVKRLFNDKVKT